MASTSVADVLRQVRMDVNRQASKSMASACAIVRNDARKNAPHDTGALQRSIDFQVSDDGCEGVVYSSIEYAPYVEIGTGIYSSKGTGRDKPWTYKSKHGFVRTSGNRPQPFLEPALQQNTSKIRDCFKGWY